MYELKQISEKCYYINCPAKIGVYVANKDNVYLVDSGNDKDAGRKIRKILDKNGWHLTAILNTHSNADHIGGNHYLQGQTGCKIYSGGIEAAFTKHPVRISGNTGWRKGLRSLMCPVQRWSLPPKHYTVSLRG